MKTPKLPDFSCETAQGIEIVRAWVDDPEDRQSIDRMAGMPFDSLTEIGKFEVKSSLVVVLWATESGDCVESLNIPADGRPTGPTFMDETVLMVSLPVGEYSAFHDEVRDTLTDGSARRCHIVPQDKK